MIFIYHDKNTVVEVEFENKYLTFDAKAPIPQVLSSIAKQFPNSILVWCDNHFKSFLNKDRLKSLLHHQKMMLSYCPNGNFFGNDIGFVEDSPFIKVNKEVCYPTWQMSSCVGIVYSKALLQMQSIDCDADFDYYLNSIAKIGMPSGLLCYSEPKLLLKTTYQNVLKTNNFELFKFVKQHYKMRWVFLLFLNLLYYKKQFPIFPFFFSMFFKNRTQQKNILNSIALQTDFKVENETAIDVLIPTIGRKKYLYNFLKDLNQQTLLPINVIIIEQNPLENSVSELEYITSEKWNFNIKHIFTNQAGACNARNIAIDQTESFWTFMADDDIEIEHDFLEKVVQKLQESASNVATINCHLKNEKQTYFHTIQWTTFGSGCSFVKTSELKKCEFNLGFEFGFGEDADFGMQLRNLGNDVLYFPSPKILHFKAPIGGFRTKPVLKWQNDLMQPKPSPTVMLYKIFHNSTEQILGYKTVLFFKFYKHQKLKNPFAYFKNFQKQWNQSLFWANELKKV